MGSGKTDLLQGTLDLIVLKLLRAAPANGWEPAELDTSGYTVIPMQTAVGFLQ